MIKLIGRISLWIVVTMAVLLHLFAVWALAQG